MNKDFPIARACPNPKIKNYESEKHRHQYFNVKSGKKLISFF